MNSFSANLPFVILILVLHATPVIWAEENPDWAKIQIQLQGKDSDSLASTLASLPNDKVPPEAVVLEIRKLTNSAQSKIKVLASYFLCKWFPETDDFNLGLRHLRKVLIDPQIALEDRQLSLNLIGPFLEDPQVKADWLAVLTKKEDDLRINVLERLSQIEKSGAFAIPAFKEIFKDRKDPMMNLVPFAMVSIAPDSKEIQALLISRSDDENLFLRSQIAYSIGHFKNPEKNVIQKALTKFLSDPVPETRLFAAVSLARQKIYLEETLDLLTKAVVSEDARKRNLGVTGLGYWGEKVAKYEKLVRPLLVDPDSRVKEKAEWALKRMLANNKNPE